VFDYIFTEYKLKKTKARLALLEILKQKHCIDISQLQETITPNICDQATLFRTLKTFMEKGIVSKTKLKDQVLYEFKAQHHHHHHFICNKCKKIIPFDGCKIDYFKKIAQQHGFLIEEHTMEFYGQCQQCQKKGQ